MSSTSKRPAAITTSPPPVCDGKENKCSPRRSKKKRATSFSDNKTTKMHVLCIDVLAERRFRFSAMHLHTHTYIHKTNIQNADSSPHMPLSHHIRKHASTRGSGTTAREGKGTEKLRRGTDRSESMAIYVGCRYVPTRTRTTTLAASIDSRVGGWGVEARP